MALTDKLSAIANAIRSKTGGTDALTLDQMATEIAGIETGGGTPDTCTVNVTTSGLIVPYISYTTVDDNGTIKQANVTPGGYQCTFKCLCNSAIAWGAVYSSVVCDKMVHVHTVAQANIYFITAAKGEVATLDITRSSSSSGGA